MVVEVGWGMGTVDVEVVEVVVVDVEVVVVYASGVALEDISSILYASEALEEARAPALSCRLLSVLFFPVVG
jgi:hypothetical protein